MTHPARISKMARHALRQGEEPSMMLDRIVKDDDRRTISRRRVLQALGVAAVGAPLSALAQGRCMLTAGTPACNTADIKPIFEPTGWKTAALDHISFQVADYRKEAAFYIALMGWKLRSDDGKQAVLDMGDWGSAIFKQAAPGAFESAAGDGGRGRAPVRVAVESFSFAIDQWNARKVEAELRKRGMTPVAENDGKGFESFRVKDPDGWNLQICNGNGLVKSRKDSPANARLSEPAPFESTGWKTVWLDHFSFGVTNYKESVSFYSNLLGWTPTYDEGSQNELLIGDIGDIIIRGGNPLDPDFGKGGGRRPGIDHISFGIAPWDTDGVKAELEKRGLRAQIDTSSRHRGPDGTWVPDEIHTAAFKSYHTATPNGFNLQISYVTHDNRLALPNAVKPKASGDI
jgi:catechol 2,3-dioxygenase-like lactoylglutathione lyase family enzyme